MSMQQTGQIEASHSTKCLVRADFKDFKQILLLLVRQEIIIDYLTDFFSYFSVHVLIFIVISITFIFNYCGIIGNPIL